MGRPASRCGGAGECCGALARPAEAWTEVLCIFVGGSFEEVFPSAPPQTPFGSLSVFAPAARSLEGDSNVAENIGPLTLYSESTLKDKPADP